MRTFSIFKDIPKRLGNIKSAAALPIFLGTILLVDVVLFVIHLFLPLEPVVLERMIDFVIYIILFLVLFVPLIRDRENLRKTDQALRESEANYRVIVEDQTELICRFTKDGTILFANTAFCNFFGYSQDKIPGSNIDVLLSTCSEVFDKKFYQELSPSHSIVTSECLLKNTSGEVRWFNWKVRAIFEKNAEGMDHLLSYQAVGNDTTTQRQTLLELQESRSKLEERVRERTRALVTSNERIRLHMTAMESTAEGIVITDRNGIVQWCNLAMTAITGYAVEEVIGQRLSMLKSGKHSREFYADLWNTILSGSPWQGVLVNRRKDGNLYYEEQVITPVKNENGEIGRFISIKHDITKRTLAEQELLHHNWELRTLNNISSQIYGSLDKHEIFLMLGTLIPREIPNLGGAIYTRDSTGGTLHKEICWGSAIEHCQDREELDLPIRAAVEQAELERKVILLAENPPNIPAYIITPFVYGERVLGTLVLTSENLENRHIHFFEAFGNQVGAAIQNAELYQEEMHLRQVAEVISSANQALVQTLDMDTVLKSMLDFLSQMVPYDLGNTMLVKGDEILASCAHVIKRQKGGTGSLNTAPMPIQNHPLLTEIMVQKKPVLVADTLTWSRSDQCLFTPGTRCWLGLPLRAGGQVIGVTILESYQPDRFTAAHVSLSVLLADQAAIAIQNAWLFDQVREGGNRLQHLSRRLVEVQETERKYIARELHDEASQALVGLKFGLDMLKSEANNPSAVIAGVNKLDQEAQQILDNLHCLAANLRPASLDHLGLVPALRQFIEGITEKYGLPIDLRVEGPVERRQNNVDINLYRIVQEALNNTIRHARATQVEVYLRKTPGFFTASVMDDGIGFNLTEALKSDRLGLFGIRERVEMTGGKLQINSVPGEGTTIFVEIPDDN